MKFACILFLFLGFLCGFVHSFPLDQKPRLEKRFLQVLDLPLESRIKFFKKSTRRSFAYLSFIFESKKYSDEVKWKALMAMVRLDSKRSKPYVKKALQHRSWYFKNAGLVAMEILDPHIAVIYARRFLEHPSLILRTASVEVIRRQKAYQYKSVLKEKLYAKENYRNNVSLWIRPYIVQALVEFSNPEDQYFFTKLLKDSDSQIQSMAFKALRYMDILDSSKPQIAREGFEPPTHGL